MTAPNPETSYHFHNVYEILFYLECDSEVHVNDTKYRLLPNRVIFIPPYINHNMFFKAGKKHTRFMLNFNSNSMTTLFNTGGNPYLSDMLSQNRFFCIDLNVFDKHKLFLVFANALKAYKAQNKNDNDVDSTRSTLSFASSISEIMSYFMLEDNEKDCTPSGNCVDNIISYIDANYMYPMSLDILAKKFHESKYSICHKFKKKTGITVLEHLNKTRINNALVMLMKNESSIIDICFDIGFNNLQHFYRTFKKETQHTPGYFANTNTEILFDNVHYRCDETAIKNSIFS
jgi:YesN/AraC family two-component response regulator